ncbi:ArsR/SmtB family transcription factor [Natranaerofaba carboxydovora]|uniref:ArsR/SmtB family transcription factor n=1 Tax=Natranaerofaba carboxydovora TaxID=2742683 RepID=UPI001F13811A|nr:metalloregulator ArsR/SmtB family transcription factor [Natranaerofaba carboxydovora]UMZ72751.1 putative HTH-type transcriptional regulator [Natranaerofaba carboxydovora]
MKKKLYELHADMCKVLSNAKRIEIIYLLKEGEKHVDEIANELGTSRANTSQHLSILRDKGLVCTRKEGLNVYFELCNPRVLEACDIMREVMLERLSDLVNSSKEILEEDRSNKGETDK